MKMAEVKNGISFDFEHCIVCGECFSHCPVFNFSRARAKQEMQNLQEGKSSPVLKWCTSCMDCDDFCKYNCHPYQLILQRWQEQYSRRGILALVETILPYSSPNLLETLRPLLPDDERKKVKEWERAADNPDSLRGADEILFLGCNQFLNPSITFTQILEGLPALGSARLCCGEPLYRMGILELMPRIAEKLTEYFCGFSNKRLIMFCPAGYNMFTNVLPKFGAKFPFEIKFLGDWLWERIEQGKIQRCSPLRLRVTVQDNCHSKQLGEDFRALNRKLIKWAGAEIVEMEHHGQQSLCCGLGAAGGWYPNVLPTLLRALREIEKIQAEAAVAYCNGCYLTLTSGRRFISGPPICHLLELIQIAIGEKPARRAKLRTRQIFRAGLSLFGSQALSLLQKPRRRIPE